MAIQVQDGGALRTITGVQVKQAGVLRTIRTIQVQDGGTLRTVATFADPLSVVPSGAGGTGSGTVTTTASNAVVTGGFSPYTYAWTLVTNGGGTASTANSPALASTTFRKTGITVGNSYVDVWRVTVTDALGNTASGDVNISFDYVGA